MGEHAGRKLGIRLMQVKIEERVLRRIGHVLQIDHNRLTKQITLGWHAPTVKPTPERKPRHGTIEYWRKVLRQAGLDADAIKGLVCDKGKWRKIIHNRKVGIEAWETSQAENHGKQCSQMRRSQASTQKQRSLVCQWFVWSKILKSITGQKLHMRRPKEQTDKKNALCMV